MDPAGQTRTNVDIVIRGVHALAVCGIVLGALSVRATEFYATRYQSLAVLDWVESRSPLVESADVPTAPLVP